MSKLGVATRRTVPGGSNVSGASSVVARKRPVLKNPAQIGAKGSATVKVHDLGGEHGLQSYMRLPPEQYSALDPGLITPLGGNRFVINVPRVSFLNIWVEPTAEVTVAQVESPRPAVVLTADSCTIRGSDFLERLRLNERFTLDMETRLEWECAHDQSGEPGEVAGAAARSASITGSTEFVVACEVVPPFDLMPRSVLQSTCNVAMTALLRALLPTFIKKLAADFNRWSQEPTYRAERAGWTESQVSD